MKTCQWRRAVYNRCVFSARLKALSARRPGSLPHSRIPISSYLAPHCSASAPTAAAWTTDDYDDNNSNNEKMCSAKHNKHTRPGTATL